MWPPVACYGNKLNLMELRPKLQNKANWIQFKIQMEADMHHFKRCSNHNSIVVIQFHSKGHQNKLWLNSITISQNGFSERRISWYFFFSFKRKIQFSPFTQHILTVSWSGEIRPSKIHDCNSKTALVALRPLPINNKYKLCKSKPSLLTDAACQV